MKIILEAQHAVGHSQPRGVGHCSINIIQSLLKRKAFDYELTFFDYGREAGNLERAEKHFGIFGTPLLECNDLDYRIASRDASVWDKKSYNEWTKTNGDIYHFMNFISIPTRIEGKVVVTVHDLNWKVYDEGTSPLVRELATVGFERLQKLKPIVITVSNSARDEILEYSNIPSKNVYVIYQSCDEENLYPDKGDITDIVDGNYIFFVGTFERKKNVARIVKAFDLVAPKCRNLKLVLAGKPTWDDPAEIYGAINTSPFKDQIITPGYISIKLKRRLYSNALCLVFPSICEGFGLPVLEAMACGCPVITADNTSLPEVGGDAVVYVNAYNTEQLAFEMMRVVSSESLRKKMIDKGFIRAKKFSWDKTAEQIENIYRMVAAN